MAKCHQISLFLPTFLLINIFLSTSLVNCQLYPALQALLAEEHPFVRNIIDHQGQICSEFCWGNDKESLPYPVYDNNSAKIFLIKPHAEQLVPQCACLTCATTVFFRPLFEPMLDLDYERQLAKNVSDYIDDFIGQCRLDKGYNHAIVEFLRQIQQVSLINPYGQPNCTESIANHVVESKCQNCTECQGKEPNKEEEGGLCHFWKNMAIGFIFAFLFSLVFNIGFVVFKARK